MRIVGVELAESERKPDDVCVIEATSLGVRVIALVLKQGDEELRGWVARDVGSDPAFLAVDAPLRCPNGSFGRLGHRICHYPSAMNSILSVRTRAAGSGLPA